MPLQRNNHYLVYQIHELNYIRANLLKKFYFAIVYIFYICYYFFININYIKNFFTEHTVEGIFNNFLLTDQISNLKFIFLYFDPK